MEHIDLVCFVVGWDNYVPERNQYRCEQITAICVRDRNDLDNSGCEAIVGGDGTSCEGSVSSRMIERAMVEMQTLRVMFLAGRVFG